MASPWLLWCGLGSFETDPGPILRWQLNPCEHPEPQPEGLPPPWVSGQQCRWQLPKAQGGLAQRRVLGVPRGGRAVGRLPHRPVRGIGLY